jgi:hypothetical protein
MERILIVAPFYQRAREVPIKRASGLGRVRAASEIAAQSERANV